MTLLVTDRSARLLNTVAQGVQPCSGDLQCRYHNFERHIDAAVTGNACVCREMEMERLRLRDEVENLQMQLASLEGETPRAVKDDTLRHVSCPLAAPTVDALEGTC